MFNKAQIKLTTYYSLLFLLLFWLFSSGLYIWMNNSFGKGFINEVQQRQSEDTDVFEKNEKVVMLAGDVALDQLRDTLILLNGGLLFIIPLASWFLAKKTLTPVRETHEKQKQFVSDASHEMRTPLAIMEGEIDVVLNKKRSAKEYRSILVSTKEETRRLANLVENLFFLAKDDQNANMVHLQAVDLTDLLNTVKHSLQTKSDKKHLSVSLSVDDALSAPLVMGHEILLRQLFYNLLDNAITYTPPKGEITISLSELKNSLIISFRDTGIGIAKEDIAKLTNRFYRVDNSRSQTKGYGLGLAIVRSVVTRHKGKLLIQSTKEKGSTFTIMLPKA